MSSIPALSRYQSRQAALNHKQYHSSSPQQTQSVHSSSSVRNSPAVHFNRSTTQNDQIPNRPKSPTSFDPGRISGLNERISVLAEQSGVRYQNLMKKACEIEMRLEEARQRSELKIKNLSDQMEQTKEESLAQNADRAAATMEWQRILSETEQRVKSKMKLVCQEFGKSEVEIRENCYNKLNETKDRIRKQEQEIRISQNNLEEIVEKEIPLIMKDLKETFRAEKETATSAMEDAVAEVRELRKWAEAEVARREQRDKELTLLAEQVEIRLLGKLEEEKYLRSQRNEEVLQKIEDGFNVMSSRIV
eukprot:GHVP01031544.1.p2 GENE.GHVP01031544.1~~GHVP01031544.1.p2  ORF type:complete len:305 (-),score=78.95 GHVP01031544.1:858-1772(-)